MNRRTLLAVSGWLAAALVATLIGLAALRVVGEGITGGPAGEVLSPDEIARQLAAATPGPSGVAGPDASGVADPDASGATGSATATREVTATPGGTVVAECDGGLARLVSWAPAQGYAVTDVDRGPDDDADLSFEGVGECEVTVVCVDGRPRVTWELDD